MKNTCSAVIRVSAAVALALLTSALTTMDAPPYRPAALPPPAPSVTQERCEIRGLDAAVRCMSIQVPLDWSRPDAEQLTVSAAIVPSLSATPAPDPLVVLAGGPGQAATDYGMLVGTAFQEVRKHRDIILFDQRGTGRSSILRCPHLSPWQYGEASVRRWARECAASVTEPQFYSLAEVVEDLEAMRRALDIPSFNLWGVSYGTLTVQQYIRRHEQRVRSAVLDGAIAPDRNLLSTAGPDADAQLQALFNECAALPDCRRRYPQLQQAFTSLLTRLARRPAQAAVKRPLSQHVNRVRLTRDAVALMIRDALYTGRTRAILPYSIDEAVHGRWDVLLAMDSELNTGPAGAMAWGSPVGWIQSPRQPVAQPWRLNSKPPCTRSRRTPLTMSVILAVPRSCCRTSSLQRPSTRPMLRACEPTAGLLCSWAGAYCDRNRTPPAASLEPRSDRPRRWTTSHGRPPRQPLAPNWKFAGALRPA